MAPVIILAGSILGFIAGVTAWLAWDASILSAAAIWVCAGPLSAVLAVAASGLSGRQPQPARPAMAEA